MKRLRHAAGARAYLQAAPVVQRSVAQRPCRRSYPPMLEMWRSATVIFLFAFDDWDGVLCLLVFYRILFLRAAGHVAYWFLMGLLAIFLVFYYGNERPIPVCNSLSGLKSHKRLA